MNSDREDLSPSESESDSDEEQPSVPPTRQTERTPNPPTDRPTPSAATRGNPTPVTRTKSGINPGAAKLPLKIRTLDGKNYNIEARTDWTVRDLKKEFDKWREGSAQCMLQYRARRLNDDDKLSVYKIEPDSVIQANFRSTGGFIKTSYKRY